MDIKEIDRILLDAASTSQESGHLEGLNNFVKKYESLIPTMNLLEETTNSNRMYFEVFDVMIKSLSRELEVIQKNVMNLEETINFKTDLYNRLKNICLAATIDQESLHILENGDFDVANDLAKMEKSLSILSQVPENNYNLRITNDKSKEMHEIGRKFLKRFSAYLTKIFIKTESKGELKIHRSFYEIMARFKFIFKFGRTQEDYYRIFSMLYIKKAKSLYVEEFQNHLNRISELINDNQSLSYCIDSLIKTYQALYECELNFMRLIEIDSPAYDVFNSVNVMIMEFLDSFFQKSHFCVLASIYPFTDSKLKSNLGSLYEDILEKYKVFEKIYISKCTDSPPSFEHATTINLLLSDESYKELLEKIKLIVFKKLSDKNEYKKSSKAIKNLQILYSIQLSETKKIIETAKNAMIPLIIDKCVEGTDLSINEFFGYIDSKKPGCDEIKSFIKSIVIENTDAKDKETIKRKLNQF